MNHPALPRHLRLLKIVITHESLAGMPVNLRFVPSATCAALMQREGLMLRATPHGAELWREEPSPPADHPVAAAPAELLPLAFAVFASSPQLQSCTNWPVARPLRYVGTAAGEPLQPETLAGSGASRTPLLHVEIDHRPTPQDDGAPPTYRIALVAKKDHWQYGCCASLASRQLHIADLDAAHVYTGPPGRKEIDMMLQAPT